MAGRDGCCALHGLVRRHPHSGTWPIWAEMGCAVRLCRVCGSAARLVCVHTDQSYVCCSGGAAIICCVCDFARYQWVAKRISRRSRPGKLELFGCV
jgi:hypothetical protein